MDKLNELRKLAGLPLKEDLTEAGPYLDLPHIETELLSIEDGLKRFKGPMDPAKFKYLGSVLRLMAADCEKRAKEVGAKEGDVKEAVVPPVESFHFGLEDEGNFTKVCLALAKAGIIVDSELAMGIFYFNFKNQKTLDKATKVAEKVIDKTKENEW